MRTAPTSRRHPAFPKAAIRQWRGEAVYHTAQRQREPYWSWEFLGDAPGQLRFHETLAHIEQQNDQGEWALASSEGIPLSDDGYDLGIKYRGLDRVTQKHRYEVHWYKPLPSIQPFRLVVHDQCNHAQLISTALN